MKQMSFYLDEVQETCTLSIDESTIVSEGYEFPTMVLMTRMKCKKPSKGKYTLWKLRG